MSDETDLQNVVGDGGDGGENAAQPSLGWRTELPSALRDHEAFKAYNTKTELWQGHIDAVTRAKELEEKLANAIPKLGKDATEDDVKAFRAALGVPESPDKYDIPDSDEPGNLVGWFKPVAHEMGLTQEQAKGLVERWEELSSAVRQAEQARIEGDMKLAVEMLKKDWGPDLEGNLRFVKQAFDVFKDEALVDLLETDVMLGDKTIKLGNHPSIIRLMFEVGKKLTPDTVVGSTPSGLNVDPVTGIIKYDWSKTGGNT